jgi:glucose-6-phosphate dehydrogenase assembly protein OpcA
MEAILMPQEIQELEETRTVPAETPGAEELIANLTKAWQDQEDATSVNGAVVRTSTINLVIFSADEEAASDAESVMPSLTEAHPCRAVHIQALPDPKAPLRATSHIHTKVENGVRVITSEQVTMKAGSEALQTLEAVVAPLLSPDLPVCLWWRGNPPFDGDLFGDLIEAADRVIYDSQAFLEAEEDLPWVLDLIHRKAQFDIAFTDVNWARLTPWRALIAQFFDGAQQMRALDGIDRISVEYVDRAVSADRVSAQAWLVVGWLASRLRWGSPGQTSSAVGGGLRFSISGPKGDIAVEIKRREGEEPPGVAMVEIHSSGPSEATYRVERVASQQVAKTTTSVVGVPPIERVVEMEEESYAALISNELDMPGRDRIYEEALTFASVLPHRK